MRIAPLLASTAAVGSFLVLGYLVHEHVARRTLRDALSVKAAKLDRYCSAQREDLAGVLHGLASTDRRAVASDAFSAMHEFEVAPCVYPRVAPRDDDDQLPNDRLFCNKVFLDDVPCMARIVVTQLATWR